MWHRKAWLFDVFQPHNEWWSAALAVFGNSFHHRSRSAVFRIVLYSFLSGHFVMLLLYYVFSLQSSSPSFSKVSHTACTTSAKVRWNRFNNTELRVGNGLSVYAFPKKIALYSEFIYTEGYWNWMLLVINPCTYLQSVIFLRFPGKKQTILGTLLFMPSGQCFRSLSRRYSLCYSRKLRSRETRVSLRLLVALRIRFPKPIVVVDLSIFVL